MEKLLREGVIDLAQLHGHESEETVKALQERTGKPIIKAFRIESEEDIRAAERSRADYVLLDSGIGGTGNALTGTWHGICAVPFSSRAARTGAARFLGYRLEQERRKV